MHRVTHTDRTVSITPARPASDWESHTNSEGFVLMVDQYKNPNLFNSFYAVITACKAFIAEYLLTAPTRNGIAVQAALREFLHQFSGDASMFVYSIKWE